MNCHEIVFVLSTLQPWWNIKCFILVLLFILLFLRPWNYTLQILNYTKTECFKMCNIIGSQVPPTCCDVILLSMWTRVVLKRMAKLKSGLSSGARKWLALNILVNPMLLITAKCGLNIVLCKYRPSMHVNCGCCKYY